MIWPALLWYALLTAAGIAVWGVLRRLGLGAGAAWAVARVVGLVGQAYVGWLGGCLGWHSWWWAGAVVLGLLAWSGRRSWRNLQLRPLVEVELVGVAAFLLLAFLRLPVLAISGTEKPMDLAIWTTLLRPGTFPPSDPWLAGETLPYYYWGFLGWVLPAKLSGLTPDVTYNLLVPTLAACTAQAGWAVARALGGSKRSGVLAAFLVVFAGTLDGWRQLLGGTGLASLDLWSSSRQIAGTITEFPLFTFQLGDLHPHLLSAPLIVVTLLFARGLGNASTGMLAVLPATILYGAAAAANPWCALPLGLAVLLVAACGINGFGWPVGDGRATWIRVITVGVAGAALYLPFWLRFRPPGRGLGLVTTATRTDELLLLLGGVLVPAGLVAWELAWRWGGVGAARRRASRALWLTGAVLVVALSRRVAVGVAVALSSVFAVTAGSGKQRLVRPALGLTLGALALLVGMELVFLRDPYGVEFYRMNTVFKSVHVVFLFLGVATPALLGWLRRRRPLLAVAGATVVVLTSLPHLVSLGLRATEVRPSGWQGLAWMAPGEASAASWLRSLPAGTVLIEGVGEAYSEAARMSATSGVPTVLGWENHELVWRGSAVTAETQRRKELITRLYSAGDPETVRSIARSLGASIVVVGALERSWYPLHGLAAVRRAGPTVFSEHGCALVWVGESPPADRREAT